MKNSKRILSAILAFAVILSTFMAVPVFAEETETTQTETESGTVFPDVKDTEKYATAVVTLNKLGIITGYEDGTFGPLNNITRAEFAAVLLRTLGMGTTVAPSTMPFPDVDTAYWAAGVIEAAKNLSIITGYDDGTFKPNNNVSYEEAITMIVRAIGYENYGTPSEVWYSKYVETANRLGITKNAIGAVGTLATRSCVAQFIFDTLEVQVIDAGVLSEATVMEKYLGILGGEGIIASNGITSITSPDLNIRDNEILIKDKETGKTEVFRVENIEEYADKLGYSVTYYYKGGGLADYKDLILFNVKAATKIEVISADLLKESECSATTIAYYRDDNSSKTSKVALDSNNVVIYNDKLYASTTEGSKFDPDNPDMIPEIGQIKLVNTDGDSDYDIVHIDNYDVYVVSTITTSKCEIKDSLSGVNSGSVILDVDDDSKIVKIVDKNGNKKSFSDISKNQSICVKTSTEAGTQLITAIIMGSAVTGKVESVSSNKVKVGSKTYYYSPVAQWVTGDTKPAPEKGSSYAFYLDINGDIFAYDKDETAEAKVQYGFILASGKKSGTSGLDDDQPTYLKILTQSGSKTDIALHKTTKIDGATKADGEAYLEGTAENQAIGYEGDKGARQLIKYTTKTVNKETVFDEIYTTESDTNEDTDKMLRMYDGFDRTDDMTYSSGGYFTNDSTDVYKGSAVVFVIPNDMTNTDNYRTGRSTDIKSGNTYKIEVFDVSSSTMTAKAILLYGANSTTAVDATTAVFRFDRYEEDMNGTEDMIKVYGYENGGSEEVDYWVASSSESRVKALTEGALVRFGKNTSGYVTLAAEDILYKPYVTDEPIWEADDESTSSSRFTDDGADFKFVLGTIYSTEDDTVIITPEFMSDGYPTKDITKKAQVLRFATSRFSDAQFLEYDLTNNTINISELDGHSITDLESYTENGEGAKVIVHSVTGKVKSVIILVEPEVEEETEETE